MVKVSRPSGIIMYPTNKHKFHNCLLKVDKYQYPQDTLGLRNPQTVGGELNHHMALTMVKPTKKLWQLMRLKKAETEFQISIHGNYHNHDATRAQSDI